MDKNIIPTEVVAALIWEGSRFLICQRPRHKARGSLWEFVGGKVEPGESKEEALIRECREELSITVQPGEVFMEVTHTYPDLTVHLTLLNASIRSGVPQLLEHQESHRRAELESRQCLSGPHKDDLLVEIDGRSAKQFASQGQTRTAALSLKLAERELHRDDLGEWPVLLLDDVLSELDRRRRDFVLRRIEGGQVFITCCEEDGLEGLEEGAAFHIRGGALAE